MTSHDLLILFVGGLLGTYIGLIVSLAVDWIVRLLSK